MRVEPELLEVIRSSIFSLKSGFATGPQTALLLWRSKRTESGSSRAKHPRMERSRRAGARHPNEPKKRANGVPLLGRNPVKCNRRSAGRPSLSDSTAARYCRKGGSPGTEKHVRLCGGRFPRLRVETRRRGSVFLAVAALRGVQLSAVRKDRTPTLTSRAQTSDRLRGNSVAALETLWRVKQASFDRDPARRGPGRFQRAILSVRSNQQSPPAVSSPVRLVALARPCH